MEQDLILGDEPEELDPLDIIDSQIGVILNLSELDNTLYDECLDDKVRVITRAMKLIYKVQASLMKNF